MAQHSLVYSALGPDSEPSPHLHLQLKLKRQIGYYMLQVRTNFIWWIFAKYYFPCHVDLIDPKPECLLQIDIGGQILTSSGFRFTSHSVSWSSPHFSPFEWQRQKQDQKFLPGSIFSVTIIQSIYANNFHIHVFVKAPVAWLSSQQVLLHF